MIFEMEQRNGFSEPVFTNPARNSSPSVLSTLGCRMTFFKAVVFLCTIVNTSRAGVICVTDQSTAPATQANAEFLHRLLMEFL